MFTSKRIAIATGLTATPGSNATILSSSPSDMADFDLHKYVLQHPHHMEKREFPCSHDDYVITVTDGSRREEIIAMLVDNFLSDETLVKSLRENADLNEEEARNLKADERLMMARIVDKGMVLQAVHKPTDRLAGVLVIITHERNKLGNSEISLKSKLRSQVMKDFYVYASRIGKDIDIFDMYPSCQAYIEFEVVGVNKLDRRKGIAEDLCRAALVIAEDHPSVSLAYGMYTSLYSRKIAEKIGMKPILEVDVQQFEDKDGKPVFQDTAPHNVVTLMIMKT